MRECDILDNIFLSVNNLITLDKCYPKNITNSVNLAYYNISTYSSNNNSLNTYTLNKCKFCNVIINDFTLNTLLPNPFIYYLKKNTLELYFYINTPDIQLINNYVQGEFVSYLSNMIKVKIYVKDENLYLISPVNLPVFSGILTSEPLCLNYVQCN